MRDHRFTEDQLKAVPTTGKPYALYEGATPGFCVRVTAHGTATYCYRSTVRGGKSRTVKIARVGEIPLKAARARALELKVQMQGGVDPAAQAVSTLLVDVVTLQDTLDYWLANTTATAKTKKENERVIRQWLQPWLARDIRSISKKDVVGRYKHILIEVRKSGRPGVVTANRTMNAMRSCWNFWMNTVEGGRATLPDEAAQAEKARRRSRIHGARAMRAHR